MIDWRIYYADGTTWDNLAGLWDNAPCDGIVCVIVRDKAYGSFILNGLDFYYSITEGEIGHSRDIAPQLRARAKWLKYGLAVPGDDWQRILAAATADAEFPRSTHPRRRSTDGHN